MPIPAAPPVPKEPIPLHVDGVLEIQRSARFWVRLAVLASVLVAAAALWLAYGGTIPWLAAVPLFLAPLLPIAAQTRIEELGRKVEEQVHDAVRASGAAPAGEAAR